jgi:uncharacterized protein YjiS (DUF1127 family)
MSILSYNSPFEVMPFGPNPVGNRQKKPGDRATGFRHWIARLAERLHAWDNDRSAWRDLSLMSDHDLMDIGLERADVGHGASMAAELDLWAHG